MVSDPHPKKECPRCDGSGEIYDAYWTCGDPDCCGSGRGECPDCGGTGEARQALTGELSEHD